MNPVARLRCEVGEPVKSGHSSSPAIEPQLTRTLYDIQDVVLKTPAVFVQPRTRGWKRKTRIFRDVPIPRYTRAPVDKITIPPKCLTMSGNLCELLYVIRWICFTGSKKGIFSLSSVRSFCLYHLFIYEREKKKQGMLGHRHHCKFNYSQKKYPALFLSIKYFKLMVWTYSIDFFFLKIGWDSTQRTLWLHSGVFSSIQTHKSIWKCFYWSEM